MKMQVRGILIVLIGVLACMQIVEAGNEPEVKDLIGYCLDQELASCRSKFEMIDSRSENLQTCSKVAVLKARYIKQHRDQLIKEMLENGIAAKCYMVKYYVNIRFYENYENAGAVASTASQAKNVKN